MQEQNSLELIYQTVKEKVDLLFQDIEHIETKLGTITAFNGVILSIALTITEHCHFYLYFVGSLLLLTAVSLGFGILRTKAYRRDPEPQKLIDRYWGKPQGELRGQLVANLVECYNLNKKQLAREARYFNICIVLSSLGLT
jgi:hypothetical protein